MTRLELLVRAEIRSAGPMRFDRFMDLALYHPELGYYRSAHDPFGIGGDFYTAVQFQPEFGELIRALILGLMPGMPPAQIRVADLGAGRGEMYSALSRFQYFQIEYGGALPENLQIVFANEFFDALPVRAGVMKSEVARELRVDAGTESLVWRTGEPLDQSSRTCVDRSWSTRSDGDQFEICENATTWIKSAATALNDGWLVIIDYGYTRRETARFPRGTLMSYRRHVASESVLLTPGARDITAHVSFDALAEDAREAGFVDVEVKMLAEVIVELLARNNDLEDATVAQRQRFKALLYGLGETFRVLMARKIGRGNEKGPDESGPTW